MMRVHYDGMRMTAPPTSFREPSTPIGCCAPGDNSIYMCSSKRPLNPVEGKTLTLNACNCSCFNNL